MYTVTVSKNYQIAIPAEIRRELGITPGQEVQIVVYDGRLEVIPVQPMQQMRGFLKGIETDVPRDHDRL